ncbi:hypothetical protein A2W24_06905 [Microgenomates group bacterium RBG_16_45_19]|nr:MAG: hypothetical protein A2W24_06905 [Microgenomates group bacterium RBG_16_45_19]
MTTITVSLPDDLASQVDVVSDRQGFATRSEFIRHLLRGYLKEELGLVEFKKLPLGEIKKGLEATGKYNNKFIDGVIKGLRQSSVYEAKAT